MDDHISAPHHNTPVKCVLSCMSVYFLEDLRDPREKVPFYLDPILLEL